MQILFSSTFGLLLAFGACPEAVPRHLRLHNSYKPRPQSLLAWGKYTVSTDVINIHDRQKLNWTTTLILALLHLVCRLLLEKINWRAFAAAVFLLYVATGLGISMGYHRLHTHRSYKVPLWLEYFFAVRGTLTLEGGPIFWVA